MNIKPKSPILRRQGFTIVEIVASFSILAIVMVVIAQTTTWCFHERHRNTNVFLANQACINILEEARGTPWEKLDEKWVQLAQDVNRHKALPLGSVIKVKVVTSKEFKLIKEVEVTVSWETGRSFDPKECTLTASIAPRSIALQGEK
ncbi:MAG: hypothetical protein CK551_06655 [Planctomycetaceae bacterium]|nr:type II secretion system protein [Gemmataceae bacterium]PHX63324.1 MAG: hypothetical protein CK551_06655 [Planctomycetaceae bacterium]